MRARLLRRLAPALVVALAAAACASPAQAYRLDGIPWPGRPATITYWNGTGYTAQVTQAVARVEPQRRARALRPRVQAPRGAADRLRPAARPRVSGLAHGSASVGYQPRNRIALGRGARGVGAVGVIAHELGHVLGLIHEDRRCATMNSVAVVALRACRRAARSCSRTTCAARSPATAAARGRRRPSCARRLPRGSTVERAPDSGRILAAITVSTAAGVVGAIEQDAVGRCPESSGGIVARAARGAGRVVRARRHAARPVRRPRRRHALRARLELRRHGPRQRGARSTRADRARRRPRPRTQARAGP